MKNPWVLAIINFVTIGVGTMIIGKRPLVGALATLGGGLLRYEELRIAPAVTGTLQMHWIVMFIGMGLLGIAVAVDAYREAKAG